jgi:hypothetical protein
MSELAFPGTDDARTVEEFDAYIKSENQSDALKLANKLTDMWMYLDMDPVDRCVLVNAASELIRLDEKVRELAAAQCDWQQP